MARAVPRAAERRRWGHVHLNMLNFTLPFVIKRKQDEIVIIHFSSLQASSYVVVSGHKPAQISKYGKMFNICIDHDYACENIQCDQISLVHCSSDA